MKDKFANLINVKNIMSLSLTVVFCILALKGNIIPEDFKEIYLMVVSFFFGYQLNKETKGA